MQITILNVSVEDKGKYQMLDVAYKDADGGTKGKKIMSFGAAASVFKIMKSAAAGTVFEVKSQKNDKGYWDWVEATQGGASPATATTGGSMAASPAPRSTYETAEERAQRQVLIVRQSSITNAIELLKCNTKKVPSVEETLAVAKQFEDFVFGRQAVAGSSIHEMLDDVPL